jgi:hypothetical protein
MIRPGQLTEYQSELFSASGKRILLGSRQSGKTETCVHNTIQGIWAGDRVAVIAQGHDMVCQIRDRVVDGLPDDSSHKWMRASLDGGGEAVFVSGYDIHSIDDLYDAVRSDIDVICADEANMLHPELLFTIEREFDDDVLLTATPRAKITPVELWAKHSPYWETRRVSMYDVPFIDAYDVEEYKADMCEERIDTDIYASIPGEDRKV